MSVVSRCIQRRCLHGAEECVGRELPRANEMLNHECIYNNLTSVRFLMLLLLILLLPWPLPLEVVTSLAALAAWVASTHRGVSVHLDAVFNMISSTEFAIGAVGVSGVGSSNSGPVTRVIALETIALNDICRDSRCALSLVLALRSVRPVLIENAWPWLILIVAISVIINTIMIDLLQTLSLWSELLLLLLL